MNSKPKCHILFPIAFAFVLVQTSALFAMETSDASIFLYDFKLQNWGLQKIEDINQGQFALVRDPQKAYVELHALYPSSSIEESTVPKTRIPPQPEEDLALAFSADHKVNNVGGRFSSYRQSPSIAQALWNGETMALTYKKETEGFCGVWMHLFDSSAPAESRMYLDSSPYQTLTFMIRGGQGGEDCSLRIADARWIEKEDSVFIGNVSSFLPSGRIDREWSQATVPLDRIPSTIKRDALGSLVFDIEKAGEGTIEIKGIRFQTKVVTVQEKRTPIRRESKQPLQRAMWVWNTPELFLDPAVREKLIRFLTRQKIGRIFLQNPALFHRQDFGKDTLNSLRPFRSLIAALKKAKVQTYALDGSRDYGQPENHDGVLATLSRIVEYNRQVPPDERFAGIHYDIESHALPGFGSARRSEYLTNQLALYEKISARLQGTGLAFGVDMPFWFDSPDELSGLQNTVMFRGQSKNVGEHILDIVDYAVIMDYRTKTEDADGIVANAEGELQYASSLGKPLFIGVEVRPVPDQTLYRFKGAPSQTIPNPFPPNGLWVLRAQADTIHSVLFTSPESFKKLDTVFPGRNGALYYIPFELPIQVSGAKISFASKNPPDMEKVLAQSESLLRQYPSFSGFSIHDYTNYVRLLEKRMEK